MKTIDLQETRTVAELLNLLDDEPLVVMKGKKAMAVLQSVEGADLETIALSLDPKFQHLIAQARTEHDERGGLSSEEVRKLFAVPLAKKSNGTPAKRKRKAN